MFWKPTLLLTILWLNGPLHASPYVRDQDALIKLLETRICKKCNLNEADLVHAQLNDADLEGSTLIRANFNQAVLANSNLRGVDLSFTSLRGASLRGADLRGAKLYGTDLRDADLSGAQLSAGALQEAHWKGARGIAPGIQSHAELHNAGVDAAQSGRWREAEALFGLAIKQSPHHGLSWVARGIARSQLVKDDLAASDWSHASTLFKHKGSVEWAKQLESAAATIKERSHKQQKVESSNGIGSNLLSGIIGGLSSIAPIALQALKYASAGM